MLIDPSSALDLSLDSPALAADLVARPSISGTEGPLADAVEKAVYQGADPKSTLEAARQQAAKLLPAK